MSNRLLVVLPFCHRDWELALRLLEWVSTIGREPSNTCLLVVASQTAEAAAVRVRAAAEHAFGSVSIVRTPKALPDEAWPVGANWMFETAVRHIADNFRKPWLWLEPDAVPVKGWLPKIEAEYFASKRKFMGQLFRPTEPGFPKQMLSGIAVYPGDASDLLSIIGSKRKVAWDVSCANRITEHAFHSPLFWNFYNQKVPPTFVAVREQVHYRNTIELSELPPSAVLIHPCKDGSLLRLLGSDGEAVKAWQAGESLSAIGRVIGFHTPIKAASKFEGIPSVTQQTDWPCGFFFTTAERDTQTTYFNPSIATVGGDDYMVSRRQVQTKDPGVWVNDFAIARIMKNMMLDKLVFPKLPTKFQREQWDDPRAVVHDGDLYIGAVVWAHGPAGGWKSTPINVHQIFTKASKSFDRLETVMRPQFGHNSLRLNPMGNFEKNWTWFNRNGEWHFVYVPSPFHTVVRVRTNGSLEEHKVMEDTRPHWNYGAIRGGTPPVLHEGEYWTFFHSSVRHPKYRGRYFIGAYTFEAEPPFAMTRISNAPLFVGSDKDPRTWGGPLCVFPGGAIMRDDVWTMTAGVNDEACMWVKIPHADLEERMIDVRPMRDKAKMKAIQSAKLARLRAGDTSVPAELVPIKTFRPPHTTFAYMTNRREPMIQWWFDSLFRELAGDFANTKIVVVDFYADEPGRKEAFAALAHCPITHVTPKPTVWQGAHRLTAINYFAASNARNTALCLAPDGWIVFCDDLSVLLPGWIQAVKDAQNTEYMVLGAYKKVKDLIVECGDVASFTPHDPGVDSRWDSGASTGPVPAAGSWLFGCSFAAPVDWLLKCGGCPEFCDSMGSEDTLLGIALERHGCQTKYDRRMLTYESEERHGLEPAFKRYDVGVSPHDKSHVALNRVLAGEKYWDNYYPNGLAAVRASVLLGEPFPVRTMPDKDWYNGQPLSEL